MAYKTNDPFSTDNLITELLDELNRGGGQYTIEQEELDEGYRRLVVSNPKGSSPMWFDMRAGPESAGGPAYELRSKGGAGLLVGGMIQASSPEDIDIMTPSQVMGRVVGEAFRTAREDESPTSRLFPLFSEGSEYAGLPRGGALWSTNFTSEAQRSKMAYALPINMLTDDYTERDNILKRIKQDITYGTGKIGESLPGFSIRKGDDSLLRLERMTSSDWTVPNEGGIGADVWYESSRDPLKQIKGYSTLDRPGREQAFLLTQGQQGLERLAAHEVSEGDDLWTFKTGSGIRSKLGTPEASSPGTTPYTRLNAIMPWETNPSAVLTGRGMITATPFHSGAAMVDPTNYRDVAGGGTAMNRIVDIKLDPRQMSREGALDFTRTLPGMTIGAGTGSVSIGKQHTGVMEEIEGKLKELTVGMNVEQRGYDYKVERAALNLPRYYDTDRDTGKFMWLAHNKGRPEAQSTEELAEYLRTQYKDINIERTAGTNPYMRLEGYGVTGFSGKGGFGFKAGFTELTGGRMSVDFGSGFGNPLSGTHANLDMVTQESKQVALSMMGAWALQPFEKQLDMLKIGLGASTGGKLGRSLRKAGYNEENPIEVSKMVSQYRQIAGDDAKNTGFLGMFQSMYRGFAGATDAQNYSNLRRFGVGYLPQDQYLYGGTFSGEERDEFMSTARRAMNRQLVDKNFQGDYETEIQRRLSKQFQWEDAGDGMSKFNYLVEKGKGMIMPFAMPLTPEWSGGATLNYEAIASLTENYPTIAGRMGASAEQGPLAGNASRAKHGWTRLAQWKMLEDAASEGTPIVPKGKDTPFTIDPRMAGRIYSKLTGVVDEMPDEKAMQLFQDTLAQEGMDPDKSTLYFPGVHTYLPTPEPFRQVDIYGEDDKESVTKLSKMYRRSFMEMNRAYSLYEEGDQHSIAESAHVARGAMHRLRKKADEVFQGKGVLGNLYGTDVEGAISERYAVKTSLKPGEVALSNKTLNRLLKSSGFSGQDIGAFKEWLHDPNSETPMSERYIPGFFGRYPQISRERGWMPAKILTEEMMAARGDALPKSGFHRSDVFVSPSHNRLAVGDEDDDPAGILGLVRKMTNSEGETTGFRFLHEDESSQPLQEWTDAMQGYQDVYGALGRQFGEQAPALDIMQSTVSDYLEGKSPLETVDEIKARPIKELVDASEQIRTSKGGMGTSYNARRWMESASASLGMHSPETFNEYFEPGSLLYQGYLDLKKDETSIMENMLNSATFYRRGDGDFHFGFNVSGRESGVAKGELAFATPVSSRTQAGSHNLLNTMINAVSKQSEVSNNMLAFMFSGSDDAYKTNLGMMEGLKGADRASALMGGIGKSVTMDAPFPIALMTSGTNRAWNKIDKKTRQPTRTFAGDISVPWMAADGSSTTMDLGELHNDPRIRRTQSMMDILSKKRLPNAQEFVDLMKTFDATPENIRGTLMKRIGGITSALGLGSGGEEVAPMIDATHPFMSEINRVVSQTSMKLPPSAAAGDLGWLTYNQSDIVPWEHTDRMREEHISNLVGKRRFNINDATGGFTDINRRSHSEKRTEIGKKYEKHIWGSSQRPENAWRWGDAPKSAGAGRTPQYLSRQIGDTMVSGVPDFGYLEGEGDNENLVIKEAKNTGNTSRVSEMNESPINRIQAAFHASALVEMAQKPYEEVEETFSAYFGSKAQHVYGLAQQGRVLTEMDTSGGDDPKTWNATRLRRRFEWRDYEERIQDAAAQAEYEMDPTGNLSVNAANIESHLMRQGREQEIVTNEPLVSFAVLGRMLQDPDKANVARELLDKVGSGSVPVQEAARGQGSMDPGYNLPVSTGGSGSWDGGDRYGFRGHALSDGGDGPDKSLRWFVDQMRDIYSSQKIEFSMGGRKKSVEEKAAGVIGAIGNFSTMKKELEPGRRLQTLPFRMKDALKPFLEGVDTSKMSLPQIVNAAMSRGGDAALGALSPMRDELTEIDKLAKDFALQSDVSQQPDMLASDQLAVFGREIGEMRAAVSVPGSPMHSFLASTAPIGDVLAGRKATVAKREALKASPGFMAIHAEASHMAREMSDVGLVANQGTPGALDNVIELIRKGDIVGAKGAMSTLFSADAEDQTYRTIAKGAQDVVKRTPSALRPELPVEVQAIADLTKSMGVDLKDAPTKKWESVSKDDFDKRIENYSKAIQTLTEKTEAYTKVQDKKATNEDRIEAKKEMDIASERAKMAERAVDILPTRQALGEKFYTGEDLNPEERSLYIKAVDYKRQQGVSEARIKGIEQREGLGEEADDGQGSGFGGFFRRTFGGFGAFYMTRLAGLGASYWKSDYASHLKEMESAYGAAGGAFGTGVGIFENPETIASRRTAQQGGIVYGQFRDDASRLSGSPFGDLAGSVLTGASAGAFLGWAGGNLESSFGKKGGALGGLGAIGGMMGAAALPIGMAVGAGALLYSQYAYSQNPEANSIAIGANLLSSDRFSNTMAGLSGRTDFASLLGYGVSNLANMGAEASAWWRGLASPQSKEQGEYLANVVRAQGNVGVTEGSLTGYRDLKDSDIPGLLSLMASRPELEGLDPGTTMPIMARMMKYQEENPLAYANLPSGQQFFDIARERAMLSGYGIDVDNLSKGLITTNKSGIPTTSKTEELSENMGRVFNGDISRWNAAKYGFETVSKIPGVWRSGMSNEELAMYSEQVGKNITATPGEEIFTARFQNYTLGQELGLGNFSLPDPSQPIQYSRQGLLSDQLETSKLARSGSIQQNLVMQGIDYNNATAFMQKAYSGGLQGIHTAERLAAWDPLAIAQQAMANPGMGEFVTSDISMQGAVTGLPMLTSSLRMGWDINNAQNDANITAGKIWGQNWQDSGSPIRGAMVNGVAAPWNPEVTLYGQRAGQAWMAQTQYEMSMASSGIAMRQQELQYAFTTGLGLDAYSPTDPRTGKAFNIQGSGGFWGLEDRSRELGYAQQEFGFEMQQKQFDLSGKQFYEQMGLQQRGMNLDRGFAQQQWEYQDQVRGLQWQWKQEDFGEEVRFMTGRQRRLAERGMKRDTVMHDIEEENIDAQRSHQKELWKLEDDRFKMQKQHYAEDRKLQEEQMQKAREFYELRKKLELEQVELSRAYFIEQQKLQKESIGLQAAQAKLIYEAQQDQIALAQFTEDQQGRVQVLRDLQVDSVDLLISKVGVLKTKIEEIFPGQGGGSSTGGSSSSDDDTVYKNDDDDVGMQSISFGTPDYSNPWEKTIVSNPSAQSSQKPIKLVVNIGNETLGTFVVNAVEKEIDV